MGALSTLLSYETGFLLAALASIISYRLLTRQINTRGLLRDKVGGRAVSPGRLQLLVVTVVTAAYCVFEVAQTRRMPEVPRELIAALGASHLLYLGGKLYGLLAGKLDLAAARAAAGPTAKPTEDE
jgi:hypothetical protein